MSTDWPEEVRLTLLPLAAPERAAGMKAYMRGRFDFFGIPTPLRRRAVAPLLRPRREGAEALAQARALWDMAERECQYVAVDLLARQVKQLGMDDLPALLGLVQRKSWWDSVDALAGVVGDIVRRGAPASQAAMDAALRHPDLWVRRVAMLHQLGWRQDTDRERLFGYALALAAEPDFFIRKAIGWALRDFARHDPQAVAAFLEGPGRALSALSRREAGKHLAGMAMV